MPCNPGPACNLSIRDVARATTAAPTYFKPLLIPVDTRNQRFKDGGMQANNPTEEGQSEVNYRHNNHHLDFIVSVGTCAHRSPLLFKNRRDDGGLRDLLNDIWGAVRGMTNTYPVHERVSNHFQTYKLSYYRFDDDTSEGWKGIKMDDWRSGLENGEYKAGSRTLQTIRDLVREFVRCKSDNLKECARKLVKRRRLRMLDNHRWERYALAQTISSPHGDCVDLRPFIQRDRFNAHNSTYHTGDEQVGRGQSWYYARDEEGGVSGD